MASGICDLGAPGLLYWLRTGLPVCFSMAACVEELQGGGGGDDLDRPAALVGELDESADCCGGACAAHDDGQGTAAAFAVIGDAPIRSAKCSASRRTLGGAG